MTPDTWTVPADNTRVAPTPRVARLRGTPAQSLRNLEAVLGLFEECSVVGHVDAPASQLSETVDAIARGLELRRYRWT